MGNNQCEEGCMRARKLMYMISEMFNRITDKTNRTNSILPSYFDRMTPYILSESIIMCAYKCRHIINYDIHNFRQIIKNEIAFHSPVFKTNDDLRPDILFCEIYGFTKRIDLNFSEYYIPVEIDKSKRATEGLRKFFSKINEKDKEKINKVVDSIEYLLQNEEKIDKCWKKEREEYLGKIGEKTDIKERTNHNQGMNIFIKQVELNGC